MPDQILRHHMAHPTEPLDFDSVEAIGLDGTGMDGNPRFPYTWANLTTEERDRMYANHSSDAEREAPR